MKKLLLSLALLALCGTVSADGGVPQVTWDRHSLLFDGHRVCPVMGEIHYSRLPADEWRDAVRRMKDGGVTIIATYVFWNHIEEQQGVFRWDGQRDLRRFLLVCKDEGLPVVLRIGPFCHGEVRNGGIPDWVFDTGCKPRSKDSVFLGFAERLYRQIFSQVQGLQWKDGGPLLACQFDNEYRGSGDYLMALKRIATSIGFDLPFYTRTGWPELSKPVPFGEMLPLYGDYADGFWERTLGETDGNYYKAFQFKAFRSSTAIATDQFGAQSSELSEQFRVQSSELRDSSSKVETNVTQPSTLNSQLSTLNSQLSTLNPQQYPYFTCELGGGMATAYHRRPYLYPEDAYSMAVVKLGSGSNLLGYYMYHGGTNPEGLTTLNENQRTRATNYNDMPVKNYDFQCPLGEFGQTYPQYYMLRPLHLFMHDYGELLAPMEATFPTPQDIPKGDDSHLRWAVRSDGASAFIFINNYERLQHLSAKRNVQLSACGVVFPRLTIPAGCMAVLPVNVDGIRFATAQLVARRDGKIYLMQVPGLPVTIALQSGRTLRKLRPLGTEKPVYKNIYLLTKAEAEHLFLAPMAHHDLGYTVTWQKVKEAGPLRPITIGVQHVAEEPQDEDFEQAAVYRIQLPAAEENSVASDKSSNASRFTLHSSLLRIDYRGDVARLYADGHLVADNFYYGRPFLYGLWRLPQGCRELELRILPLQADAPIYLPREADKTPGEQLNAVSLIETW